MNDSQIGQSIQNIFAPSGREKTDAPRVSSEKEKAEAYSDNDEAVQSLNQSTRQLLETRAIIDDIKKTLASFSDNFLIYLASIDKSVEDVRNAAQMTIPESTEKAFKELAYEACYGVIVKGMRTEANEITKDVVRCFTQESERHINRLHNRKRRFSMPLETMYCMLMVILGLVIIFASTLVMNLTVFRNWALWMIIIITIIFVMLGCVLIVITHTYFENLFKSRNTDNEN